MTLYNSKSELVPVSCPVIGKRYHTSWSNNKHMSWVLVNINSDGSCILASKDNRFETRLTSLRTKLPIRKAKALKVQLSITFKD